MWTPRAIGWKLYYVALESAWTFRTLSALVRAIAYVKGPPAAAAAIEALAARIVWSGWPRDARGWVNVSASALCWRLRRAFNPAAGPAAASRPARPESARLRVGCFGAFSGLLGFARGFFEHAPASIDLYVYDVQYRDRLATYIRDSVSTYRPMVPSAGEHWIRDAAQSINDDDLDVLINVHPKADAYRLLDLADTPCVVNICTGSDLVHHRRVGFHLHAQPEVDFVPASHALRCTVTGRPMTGRVYDAWMLYDLRDIDLDVPLQPWSARRPLVVAHGSLYKFTSRTFLDVIFALLADDAKVELVLVGKDTGGALTAILEHATRKGVASRVHHAGSFEHLRDARGDEESQDGWHALRELLATARLAPNPWPVGGGSARFEAFALGVPSIHLRMPTGRRAWCRTDGTVVDLPALTVERGTAHSPREYGELCRRALYDGVFADALARQQREVARKVSDPGAYWQQLLSCHRDWVKGSDV